MLNRDGKQPIRAHQEEVYQTVLSALNKYDVVGLNAPPGWGKSYLARAWQRSIGYTDILTASNVLVDQYARDYPELNVVKGRTHYDTQAEYQRAKQLARDSEDSIFNPLSALFTRIGHFGQTRCIIVDEAHTLADMLRSSATTSFNTSKSRIPQEVDSEFSLSKWAQERFAALNEVIRRPNVTPEQLAEFERVAAIYYSIVGHETENVFKVHREVRSVRGRRQETLKVDAVDCPAGLIQQVLRADKIILMSGTLTEDETRMLATGRSYTWLSRPYLAPAANRPVFIQSVAQELRRDVPTLAAQVRRIYEAEGRRPTLVHVTYGDAAQYMQELQDLNPITNGSANKYATEQQFRANGGLWIAAGCAEGIDLADDACRVLIIPSLMFPNKGDLHVQKRLGLPGGQRWYCLKTLENTIQRLGRGLRHIGDQCNSYILDPAFPRLWGDYKNQFEPLAIVWGTTK